MVERAAVNRFVVGSSPTGGARLLSTERNANPVNARRREIGCRAFCVYGPVFPRVCVTLRFLVPSLYRNRDIPNPGWPTLESLVWPNLGQEVSKSLFNRPSKVNTRHPFEQWPRNCVRRWIAGPVRVRILANRGRPITISAGVAERSNLLLLSAAAFLITHMYWRCLELVAGVVSELRSSYVCAMLQRENV